MIRTKFPEFHLNTVLQHFTDLYNCLELFGEKELIAYRKKLSRKKKWSTEYIFRVERQAITESNWTDDKYIRERIEGLEKGKFHELSSMRERMKGAKGRKKLSLTKKYKVKKMKKCFLCDCKKTADQFTIYGKMGVKICKHCAGELNKQKDRARKREIRRKQKCNSTSLDSAKTTTLTTPPKDISTVNQDGSKLNVPSAQATQDTTLASTLKMDTSIVGDADSNMPPK